MESPSIVPDQVYEPASMAPLNRLARECHADNQHWWHDPRTGAPLDRNKGELFMLMVSEVAEAMEGERKDLADDHLPHRRMAEVELADVIIRIMDYAGAKKFDLDSGVAIVALDPFPSNKAQALLQISHELTDAGTCNYEQWTCYRLCVAIALTQRYALKHGYDLDGAVMEKRAYNAVRADHKAAARLAANGKKF
jgi:hypothetical protein